MCYYNYIFFKVMDLYCNLVQENNLQCNSVLKKVMINTLQVSIRTMYYI